MQKKMEIKDVPVELKYFDLTQNQLIYDGILQLKKNTNITFHCLLFDGLMVFLQKTVNICPLYLKSHKIPNENSRVNTLFFVENPL